MKFIKKIAGILKIADRKTAAIISSSLAVKAEQMKEYEKRFEPKPQEPDPMENLAESLAKVGFSASEAASALSMAAAAMRPEPMSHMTNNWRKMHGLPMRRKTLEMRRRKR